MSSSSNRATSRTDTLGAPEKASYASLGSLQVSPPPRRPPPESWYDTQVTLDVDAAWAIRQPRMRTASHAVLANKPGPRGTEVQEARAETIDPAAIGLRRRTGGAEGRWVQTAVVDDGVNGLIGPSS